MSQYKCDKCLKTFAHKQCLSKHIANSVCVGKHYENENDNDSQFKCKYCRKVFTTSTSMYRHVNHTCKIKKHCDVKKSEMYIRLFNLEEENKLLKKVVSSLKRTKALLSDMDTRICQNTLI
jgi:hypothetical protein